MMMDYPFTQDELNTAVDTWGCNCGPSALAFALQRPLCDARHSIPDFEVKRYTSPTMMKQALALLRVAVTGVSVPSKELMFDYWPALVRIQWTGPWTAPGGNPKWAYWHTHWITTWIQEKQNLIFDCNGGAQLFAGWTHDTVPLLIPKRGDGGWRPTHIWRIKK